MIIAIVLFSFFYVLSSQIQKSYGVSLAGEERRSRRSYLINGYRSPYYYNTPFFSLGEYSPQSSFYVRHEIPLNNAARNTYYGNPGNPFGVSFTKAFLQKRNPKQYSLSKSLNVGDVKRSFKEVLKSGKASKINRNKMLVQRDNHSEIPDMINIPFKSKFASKPKFNITQPNVKMLMNIHNGEKRRVPNKSEIKDGNTEASMEKKQKSSKDNLILKNDSQKIINDIIDENNNEKQKNLSLDAITDNKKLTGREDRQISYKRNSTQEDHQNNIMTASIVVKQKHAEEFIKSAKRIDNPETKNILKNISNGLKNTWQGVKNFTAYLKGPNQSKDKSQSKRKNPHLWHPSSIKHDAAKEDWFGVEEEPDPKTQNDLKISKNKFFAELLKTKMTSKPERVSHSKGSKTSENNVKKFVDLVEASEHEELKNIVQDSVGSPIKGELKRIPLSDENLKNVEREKNAYIGANESNEINKLIANYKDDFDVFVDKSINHQSDAGYTQTKDEMLTGDANDADVQFDIDETLGNDLSEEVDKKKKTGSHHSNNYGQPSKEITLGVNAQKWESNKKLFDEEKNDLSMKNNEIQGNNNLEQYFSQTQNQGIQSRQNKRRQKINATLTMLSDIEHQIDGMIKDKGNDDQTNAENFSLNARKRGKARIFDELVNGQNRDEEMDTNESETGQQFGREEMSGSFNDEEMNSNERKTRNKEAMLLIAPRHQDISFNNNNHLSVVEQNQPQNRFYDRNNDGKMINAEVAKSDNVDHILQAKALKNIQDYEMNNDLQTMKEVTQRGLREMFGDAVKKQQTFIDTLEGIDNESPGTFLQESPIRTFSQQAMPVMRTNESFDEDVQYEDKNEERDNIFPTEDKQK